ncbi:uncharacterized protein LOC110044379 [Orbicella faveolata]|uniref:uncharacterized protein LOC110044379 n=1 Tax=Orbicella faveolata TaxID=48498 RepID=UPI0009E3EE6A|nr:uncharacterized protein LOC110044379 [Orbicella faveolata]
MDIVNTIMYNVLYIIICIVNQKTIEQGTSDQDVKIAAAIEIQRVWRGYYTRCKLFGILHPSASVMSTVLGSRFIQSPSRLSDVRTVTPMVPHTTPQPSTSRKVRLKSFSLQKLYEHTCTNEGSWYKE